MKLVHAFSLLCFVALTTGPLSAQSHAQLGQIADQDGNPKADARQDRDKKPAMDADSMVARIKRAIEDGEISAEIGAAKIRAIKGKRKSARSSKRTGRVGFYAIVIGRLKTKDVESGTFTMDVDHVTSIYENRWVKDKIVGETVTVEGVAGPFLDNLLLLKRGETLRFRSGNFHDMTLSFGSKFHVLERSEPFDPGVYGIPPQDARGFRGVVTGEIKEIDQGFELIIEVDAVEELDSSSTAKDPDSVIGQRIKVINFFRHQEAFRKLQLGDRIRVDVVHEDPGADSLRAGRSLEKIDD